MENTIAMDKKEMRKKRKKRRRRVHRLFFLLLLILFLTQTDMGLGLLSNAREIEVNELIVFAKKTGEFGLSILPKLQEWVGDKMAYVANFL